MYKVLVSLMLIVPCSTASYAQSLVRVEVNGSQEVAEMFHASFTATAFFDDDTKRDVTTDAVWSIEPESAGVFGKPGVLTTSEIGERELAAIVSAKYVHNDIEKTGNHGVTILPTGAAHRALHFNGQNAFVQVPDSDSLHLGTQATLEAWIRPAAGEDEARIINKEDGVDCDTERSFSLGIAQIGQNRGFPSAGFFLGEVGSCEWIQIYDEKVIETEKWMHSAVTIDTAIPIVRLYINGELVEETDRLKNGQKIPHKPIRNHGLPLRIGGLPPYSDTFFGGQIDEVRIWNVARSQDEIRAAMYRRFQCEQEGLVGYWHFDEASGDGVRDSSGHGNDGVKNGPVSVKSDVPLGPPNYSGDTNCDGSVDLQDVESFILALVDPAEYETKYPDCHLWLADMNDDGSVDLVDIEGFIACMIDCECP